MGDAEIIPIGTGGRPGRGSGSARPSNASRGLAGDAARPTRKAAPRKPALVDDARRGRRHRDPGTEERAVRRRPRTARPLGALSPGDWLSALQTGARQVFGEDWEAQLAQFLAFLRRRLSGDYEVDEYGFDPEVAERLLLASLRPVAQKWFRIEARGVENLPAEGGALVVSNHSGTLPVDGLMTMLTIHDETGRFLRPLGRGPGLPDAGGEQPGPQGRRHAGVQRGRRADARRR